MVQGTAVLLTVLGFGFTAAEGVSQPWFVNLAEDDTAGTPMLIDVVVFEADGKTPVADAHVTIYHSGPSGCLNNHEHRFEGFVRTDAQGRFQFRSVRPSPFPDPHSPAHVHIIIRPIDGPRSFQELRFAGDPNLSRSQIRQDRERGDFRSVQALKADKQGVYRGSWKLKLDDLVAI